MSHGYLYQRLKVLSHAIPQDQRVFLKLKKVESGVEEGGGGSGGGSSAKPSMERVYFTHFS